MWVPILLIIIVIFVLKSIMSSHKAAVIPMQVSCVSQSNGSSGCKFTGCTTVAGVCEPAPPVFTPIPVTKPIASGPMPGPMPVHCCHIIATFPIDAPLPPPIKILQPVRPITPVRKCGGPVFQRCLGPLGGPTDCQALTTLGGNYCAYSGNNTGGSSRRRLL